MIYSPWGNAFHQPKEQTTTTCRLPNSSDGKGSACNSGDLGTIPGREDPQEKERATHSSTLAWRLPWTGKPGELQSTGSQRAGHDWEANTHSTTSVCTLHRHTLREREATKESVCQMAPLTWSSTGKLINGGGVRIVVPYRVGDGGRNWLAALGSLLGWRTCSIS